MKIKSILGSITAVALASAALAQPATFTDLGDRSTAAANTTNVVTLVAANDIQWFKVHLPAVAAAGGFVDIYTEAPGSDMTDTMLCLYDNTGALKNYDDDSGPGFWSLLSYGSTTSRGPVTWPGSATDSLQRSGAQGALADGIYWIGVLHYGFPYTFTAGWTVTDSYTGTERTTNLFLDVQPNNVSTPPGLSLPTVAPSPASGGSPVVASVLVNPGQVPASTGLVVTADLSGLGGSATAAMHDDGLNGDAVAGDGRYSVQFTAPTSVPDDFSAGTTGTITFNAHDAQARNATPATASLTVLGPVSWDETANGGGDAGQDLASAQVPTGASLKAITGALTAGDADIYKIGVCDVAAFEATTRFGGGAPDTQLFLFDANGVGVAQDDDNPAGVSPASVNGALSSTLVGVPGLATGTYYLAISYFDKDPLNAAGQQIWIDTPYNVVRASDGATAAGDFAIASWDTGNTATTYSYRISFKGACPSGPALCSAADIGIQGGTAGHDNHLDNNDFVVFINLFFNNDPAADIGIQGGTPGHDGVWDNNDFIVYINIFFNDQANCTG